MPDDLDDLLRSAMKTLDDQVPSGYFEDLSQRTLARLEASMQSGTTGPTARDQSTGVPPPPQQREEDSGLHDIRALAQSTKTRLSSKRSTTNPPMGDEDVLASTSAGWKAVALPEPAKMVSLPSLDELPPKEEVLAKDAATPIGARIAAKKKAKSSKVLAFVGLGVAAAAGVTVFVTTQQSSKDAAIAPASAPAPARADVAAQPPAPPPVQQIAAPEAKAEAAAAAAKAPDDGATGANKPGDHVAVPAKGSKTTPKKKVVQPDVKKEETKAPPPADTKAKKDDTGSGDPSFDQLLKEAGVDETKKQVKPKLDKKELSRDDFMKGIGAVAKRAQACYKGTQGTAMVKLTIAPSGKVSKVTVSGMFDGKPEADCVSKAVNAASFPPWDGGPQSFTYSYLLSE